MNRHLVRTLPLATVLLLFTVACRAEPGAEPEAPERSGTTELTTELTLGSGGTNAPDHLDAPYVVMLSLDGFRWDYMELFETPNLDRIADRGVHAPEGMTPIFPVKTFPNHYSIATGMYAENHGLVGNDFYVPAMDAYYAIGDRDAVENGAFYGGEPIWVTAEEQGMVTASYFWVGTEAPVQGIQPSTWHPFDAAVSYEQRVDSVLAWLDRPPETRPHLITFYFEETDSAGHGAPPDSPEMRTAVATVDRMVGRLLDGLEELPHGDRVYLLVVSDHGMGRFGPERSYFLPDAVEEIGEVRMLEDRIEWGEDVTILEAGPHAFLYVDGDEARRRSLRDALDGAMPHADVYRREDVPERYHYADSGPRGADIVVIPEFPWMIWPWSASQREARVGYTHGWGPDVPEMQALFLAMGPRLAAGATVPPFDNVHIYPLIAEILGLAPNPAIDGRLEMWEGVLR